MDKKRITGKQLLAVLFAGLLSPMLRVIPEQTGRLAGAGGWVAPLLAVPVFLLAVVVLGKSLRRLPEGSGLPDLYRFSFGRVLGRLISIITGLWLLVTAVSALRYYGESFLSSIYPDTDIWIFLVGLMAVAWWACSQGLGTVCRMGHLFFYALLAMAGVVVILGMREVHLYHIWPIWMEGWDKVGQSGLTILSLLGNSLVILFCRGEIVREKGGLKQTAVWFGALAGVLAVLGLVVIGMFGWQTAVRLQMPFFSAAKEVTVLGVFERVEAVIAATWVFSDLAMQCLFLWTGVELLSGGKEKGRRWVQGSWAVIAVVSAVFMLPTSFELDQIWQEKLRWVDAVVNYAIPLAACIPAWVKKRPSTTTFGRK